MKIRLGTFTRYLISSSLVYLALPYLIFFVGWLKWYWAVLGVGVLMGSLYVCLRRANRVAEEPSPGPEVVIGWQVILLTIVVSVLILGFSGVGGYGYQDTDWIKHNAILKDLIEKPWPPVYQIGGHKLPLVYYVAYYLPAAVVGKLGGWTLANQVLFLWSLAGLILALFWFLVLARRFAWTVVLLFVFFSGLDVIGELLVRWVVIPLRPEALSLLSWGHIESWSIGWQYSSNMTLLFWVPHQALAGWIAAGMLLYAILNSHRAGFSLFVASLTLIWSPFVTIGLLPYLTAEFFLGTGTLVERLKRYVTAPNLGGVGLFAIVGIYYCAKFLPALPLTGGDIPWGWSLALVPDSGARLIGLILILLFCLLEFGLYGLFIIGTRRDWDRRARGVVIATLVWLFLLPFYKIGGMNDLVMRASIPSLFALAVFLGWTLHSQSLSGWKRIVLVGLIVIGSVTPLIEIHRHAENILDAGSLVQIPQMGEVMSVDEWGMTTEKDVEIIRQYVGSSQALFFTWMARGR